MSERDAPKRIAWYGKPSDLRRIALTAAGLVARLPSFSAEDERRAPRHKWFVSNYGTTSVELDAPSPSVLRDGVEEAIQPLIDAAAWHRTEAVEAAKRDSFFEILDAWSGISRRASNCSCEGVR